MSNKIGALNPYVNEVPDTDPLIVRVPMHDTGIGARPATLKTAFPSKADEMTLSHNRAGVTGRK